MSAPDAILSLVILGVADLERSIAFYEALGFRRKAKAAQGVGFFQAGAVTFAVWPADELAKDANVAAAGPAPALPCPSRRGRRSGAAMPAISPIQTVISGRSRATRGFR